MNILLTGHEGYLGSRLHDYLSERGHRVIGFGRREDIATITTAMLEKLQIEVVINCATAANRVDQRYVLGGRDEEVNVSGVRALVQALAETEIGLIHVSTKDIYGDVYARRDVTEIAGRLVPAFAVNESQPFRPSSIYAKTKLMGEFIAEAHAKTTILRLSSGYTSQLHTGGNWILHFCRAAGAGKPVRINGSGMQLRDPVHVDDLGELMLLIVEKAAWGLKLNVGGGMDSAYSILEVLNMIEPDLPKTFTEGGDLGYVTDIELARKSVGWLPKLSFRDELRLLIKRVAHE